MNLRLIHSLAESFPSLSSAPGRDSQFAVKADSSHSIPPGLSSRSVRSRAHLADPTATLTRQIQHPEADALSHGGVKVRGMTHQVALCLQAAWINSMADGSAAESTATMHRVVTALRRRCRLTSKTRSRTDRPYGHSTKAIFRSVIAKLQLHSPSA